MKYSLLNNSIGPEIGYFPQAICRDTENMILELTKGAILTDMISAVNVFDNEEIIISEKALEIFRRFLNADAVIKPVNFTNAIAKYFFVFFPKGIEDIIDFEKSECGIYKPSYRKLASIIIKDYKDYISKCGSYYMGEETGYDFGVKIYCTEINFKRDPLIDIGSIVTQDYFYKLHGLIISDDVKEAIIENKLTGFKIDELVYSIG